MHACMRRPRGLSLVELLIGVAIVALLALVAVPSFSRFIAVQRVRAISAALVTDIQFVRTEAASRNVKVGIKFDPDLVGTTTTCYVVMTGLPSLCDCHLPPGTNSVCTGADQREIRTVQVPRDSDITLAIPNGQGSRIRFDPATGRVEVAILDTYTPPMVPFMIEVGHPTVGSLVTLIEGTGRPTTCSPNGKISGVPACT